MSRIVLEDFNGGNGCYKVNLAELNKEQVEEIENLVKKWNPEIEESEDERIRKGLLYVIEHHPALPTEEAEEYIAWLEKQGEQKPSNKVEPKFKVGDIIRHKEQGFTCKIIAVDTEYILSGCSGNHLPFDSQDAYELVEQKSADKVEPKFHEGEWVVNKFGDVWHIDSFDKKNYQVSNGNEYNYFPISKQNEMHLWTIEDVKDGDVLAVTMYIGGTWIGIFKEQNDNK